MRIDPRFARACRWLSAAVLSLNCSAYAQAPAPTQSAPVALLGGVLHLGNGEQIANGSVIFEQGRISAIGSAVRVPEAAIRIELNGSHVYPGLILLDSTLGLVEVEAVRATVDSSELGELNPSVRSADAYNVDSALLPASRFNGVLTAQIAPTGAVISGRSSVMQLDAWNAEEALLRADDGLWLNWPVPRAAQFDFSSLSIALIDNPNYAAQLASLENLFAQARSYHQLERPDRNLKLEALGPLLDGRARLYVRTELAADFAQAMDFARRHDIQSVVWVGAAEAEQLAGLLAARQIPVILGSVHRLPLYDDNPFDAPYRLAARLHQAGVTVALTHQGTMNARNLAFQAGSARAYGVPDEQALAMITSVPAQLLGLSDELGTLKVGARATLFVSTGDALDMVGNHLTHAFIDGRQIDLIGRQQQLYQRYRERLATE